MRGSGGTPDAGPYSIGTVLLVGIVAVAGGAAASLAGARWWGAAAAAVAAALSSFAPTLLDRQRARRQTITRRHEVIEDLTEPPLPVPENFPSRALLLHPARAVVPFAGREAELGELLDWCLASGARPVKLLAGAGGVGKTRLALRLRDEVASRSWAAIVLRPGGDLAEVLEAETRRPLLLVIDYAETRDNLDKLIAALSAHASPERGSVRLLLLARDSGEWLERLRLSPALGAAARDLVPVEPRDGTRSVDVIRLGVQASLGWSASEEVHRAIPYFAKELGVRDLNLPAAVELRGETDAVPLLVLHAQALVYALALAAGAHPVAPPGADQVVSELLTHERVLWTQALAARGIAHLDQRTLGQAMSVLCLCPARNATDAAKLLALAPALRGRDESFLDTLAWRLRDIYPADPPAWWGSLAPDLIAEWLVAETLTRPGDYESHHLARGLVARLQDSDGQAQCADSDELAVHALGVLTRATKHHQELAPLLTEIAHGPLSHDTVRRFSQILPHPTNTLADAAVITARRVRDSLDERDSDAEAAGANRVLGVRLIQAGRRSGAVDPLNEAARLYRDLADTDPRYRERLADTLVDVGAVWLESGRPDLALTALRESTHVWLLLSHTRRKELRLNLASSYTNLAICMAETGAPGAAIIALSQAMDASKEAIEANPRDLSAHWHRAVALTNLSIYLRDETLGDQRNIDAAVVSAKEAVSVCRQLAEFNPDKYQPDLASSIVNLAGAMKDQRHPDDELCAREEAAELFGKLAMVSPLRFRGSYAEALLQVGIIHTLADRLQAAVGPLTQAVEAFREHAQTGGDDSRVRLADAQGTLGAVITVVGLPPREMNAHLTASLESERRLAATHPSRAERLAAALSKHGAFLAGDGDRSGFAELREAAAIFRDLGEGYHGPLAETLMKLGNALSHAREGASAEFGEAGELLRPLAQAHPPAYTWELAKALMALGCEYMVGRRLAEAAVTLHEALNTARRAEEIKPGTCAGWSEIVFLENLGSAYRLLDQPTDAEPYLTLATNKWISLSETDPGMLQGLPRAIDDYVKVLRRLGRTDEAARYEAKAEEIRQVLGDGGTEDNLPSFPEPE